MNVGIVIFPGVEEPDFVGPWEIISMRSVHAEGPEQRFKDLILYLNSSRAASNKEFKFKVQ
jgi:hypothetical protein